MATTFKSYMAQLDHKITYPESLILMDPYMEIPRGYNILGNKSNPELGIKWHGSKNKQQQAKQSWL